MEIFNFSKVVGACVIIASLATLPLVPVSAQDGTVRDSSQAAPGDKAIYGTGEIDQGERSFDWGWIGLLGLVGLAGRLAKHRQEAVDYSGHNEIHRSVSTVTTEEAVRYREPKEINSLDTTEEAVRYKEPKEINSLGITDEKAARYRDPQKTNRPGTDGTSNR